MGKLGKQGRIHSVDTFGTVDGPGIRFVVFMQGCALQCAYCHNPDTWDTSLGTLTSVDEVLALIEPYLEYYKRSGGGLTVTGGEPTLQAPFVAELFRRVKEQWGLHTALDSSGFCDPEHAAELLDVTDLVLLDLKVMNRDAHTELAGQPNDRILRFASALAERGTPVWLRRVVIPGYTDALDDLEAMGRFIAGMANIKKLELLPYHRLGVYKWHQLGRTYPLEGVREPEPRDIDRAMAAVMAGMRAGSGIGCAD